MTSGLLCLVHMRRMFAAIVPLRGTCWYYVSLLTQP